MTLVLLLLACPGKETDSLPIDTGDGLDCPTPSTWYLDQDADGFGAGVAQGQGCVRPDGQVANDADCDDVDPGVRPGADERCDGVDNNCDGQVDDLASVVDALECLIDADADGFGLDGSSEWACDCVDGLAFDGGDCDDTQPAVYPGAEEACDGIDNNCDGEVDPGLTGTWYEDADGDGYGNAGTEVVGCPPADGLWIDDPEDCDDNDPTVNPGVLDICFDLVDQDCNGRIDECGLKNLNEPDDAWWTVYREPDPEVRPRGGMGHILAHFGDSNENGRNELLVGVTEGRASSICTTGDLDDDCVFQTQLLLVESPSGSSAREDELADVTILASWETLDDEGLFSGMYYLADALLITQHDLDGDGLEDFLFGDRLAWLDPDLRDVDNSAGRIHLVDGPPPFGTTETDPAALEDYRTIRLYDQVTIDGGLAFLPDPDASLDWRVAASLTPVDDSLEGTEVPFAMLLGLDHFDGTVSTDDATQFWSEAPYMAGTNVESGDLDGDGIFDLAFGSETYLDEGLPPGRVWAFLGPFDADRGMADADWTISGTQDLDNFGETLFIFPDLDDDGRQELVVNRSPPTGFDSGFATYVYNLGIDCPSGSCSMTDAGGVIQGELDVEGFETMSPHESYNPAVLPDTDGDGRPELAITVGMNGGGYTRGDSGVFLYSTPLRGTWNVTDAHTRIVADVTSSFLGSATLGGVDYDGDGLEDIVVGEYQWDPAGEVYTGYGRFMIFRGGM